MKHMLRWIRTYPLTLLMIASFIVGGVYFGTDRGVKAYETWENTTIYRDSLQTMTGFNEEISPLAKIDKLNTTDDLQAAIESGEVSPFTQVDQSYLDDAVFIGDSRTDTLRLYANWDNATYYCKTGTNIWALMDDESATDPDTGKAISIRQALGKIKFGKVYIMCGINELGTGTAETYYQQFKSVVEEIRQLQPDAIIFVESIMHVTAAKDKEGSVINNKNINERNQWLEKLADNKTIFYIDENEALDTKKGTLKADYTFDGVHLTSDHVEPWKEFILAHGVRTVGENSDNK